MTDKAKQKLAHGLILDELFDLTLYKKIREFSKGDTSSMLDELIIVEERHFSFWQGFFEIHVSNLNFGRKVKLKVLVLFTRLTGETGINLILEAIEIYGIKKYLQVWNIYKNDPLGKAVREVLEDEFKHEEAIVSDATRRKIYPERIRNIFLGFNDGLVEIIGVISGFFAVFQTVSSVLVAGFTVAIAGSISMAAGAYVALGSEKEVKDTEVQKKKFLGEDVEYDKSSHPIVSAFVVGISYFIGAMIPVLPVLFGAQNILISIIAAAAAIIIVSYILAFLSGMDVKRRITINLVVIAIAVWVTYTIGLLARSMLGVSI